MSNSFSSMFSLFNWSKQTIVNNPKIQTLIDSFRLSFFEGRIRFSLESLDNAIKEHSGDSEIEYKLLILKSIFLLNLHRVDDVKDIIKVIEKDYAKYNDIGLDELKLNILSADKDAEDEFETYVSRIVAKISQPKEYFYAIRALNLKDFETAFKIIEALEEKQELTGKYLFLKGLVNLKFFYQRPKADNFKEDEYYTKARMLFVQYLSSKKELNALEKLDIYINLSYLLMNRFWHRLNIDNYHDLFNELELSVKQINDDVCYFDKNYQQVIINYYLTVKLFYNKLDEYVKFAEDHVVDLTLENYFRFNLEKGTINDSTVLLYFNTKKDSAIIDLYYNYLEKDKKFQEFIHFIIDNNIDISDDILFKQFIEAHLICDHPINDSYLTRIDNDKRKSVYTLSTYLLLKIRRLEKVSVEDIVVFSSFLKDKSITIRTIQNSLNIIFRLKFYDHASVVVEFHIKEHDELLGYIIKWQIDNKTLPLYEFEDYLNKYAFLKTKYLHGIGTVYFLYGRFDVSIENYFIVWRENKYIELALGIFQTLVGTNFLKIENNIKSYRTLLEEVYGFIKSSNNSFKNELQFMLMEVKYHIILKHYEDAICQFNHLFLSSSPNDYSQQEIDFIMTFYFDLMENIHKINLLTFDENKVLVIDDIMYITGDYNICEERKNQLHIELINKSDFNEKYKHNSDRLTSLCNLLLISIAPLSSNVRFFDASPYLPL